MKNPSAMADFFCVLWSLWFGILVTERSRSAPTKRNVMSRSEREKMNAAFRLSLNDRHD